MQLRPVLISSAAIPATLVVVIVLLLQFGTGNATVVTDPASQSAGLTATIVHNDCASDECPMNDCASQQDCGTSGGAACHCSCVQMPPLAGVVVTPVGALPEMATAEFRPTIVTRRLDTPFRPPA